MKTTFKLSKTPANARKLLKLRSFIKTINFDNMQEYIELAKTQDIKDSQYVDIRQPLMDYNNHCVLFCKNNTTRRALTEHFEDPQQVAVLVESKRIEDIWTAQNCGFAVVYTTKQLQKYSHVIIDNVHWMDTNEYMKLLYGKDSVICLVDYTNILMSVDYSGNTILSPRDNIMWQYVYEKQKTYPAKMPYRYFDYRNVLANKLLGVKEKADLLNFYGFLDLDEFFEETPLTFDQLKLFIRKQKDSSTYAVYGDEEFKSRLYKIKKFKISDNPDIVIVKNNYPYDKEILKRLPVYVVN